MTNQENKNEELKSTTKEVFDKLEDSAIKSEQFFEKNLKTIAYVFTAFVAVIIGFYAYLNYFQKPKNNRAFEEMEEAQKFFYQDSIKKALNGGSAYLGFEQIIEDYGNTNAGNLAKYYAAISYYKKKDYNKAIETMEDFDPKGDDVLVSIKNGVMADSYVQTKEIEKALDSYEKAIKQSESIETLYVFYNKKAGIVSYMNNQKKEANKYFTAILEKYPNTQAKDEIEKYAALTQ